MSYLIVQGNALRLPLADQSVDLVFGSPPYVDCRKYLEHGRDLGISRKLQEWVDWMILVTEECLRVCRGPVIWVAAGKTKNRNYWPVCEGLMWEWHKGGGHAYRPCFWHRSGVSGSGSDQWFRSDIEHVMCFKRPGPLPWANNTAMGSPCKHGVGGQMSYRNADGRRINAKKEMKPGRKGKMAALAEATFEPQTIAFLQDEIPFVPGMKLNTKRLASGQSRVKVYIPPAIANPGNLIHTNTGGGQLGSRIAHENEAPFPEDLAKFFLLSLCPPGGTVLDPFSGSGTTTKVAECYNRHGIGLDLRRSQCELGRRRIREDLKPLSPLDDKRKRRKSLPGQMLMFDNIEKTE